MSFFIVAILNWLDRSGRQDTLSEVIAGVTSPLEIDFFFFAQVLILQLSILSPQCYMHSKLFISKTELFVGVNKYFCHLIHVRVI